LGETLITPPVDATHMPEIDQKKVARIPKEMIELLADEVAYKILKSSIRGLKATAKNAAEFGITHRQYYRRMAHLLKAGLIEKHGKMYEATLLGSKILELYERFVSITARSQQLRIIDKIAKIEEVSPFDLQTIKQALGAINQEEARSLKIITSYDDLVSGIIYLLDSARENLVMATRYKDRRVTEAIAKAVKRGVKCYFIAEEKHALTPRVSLQMSLLPDLESTKAFIEMVKAPNFKVRYKDLLYSFVVVDGRYVGIEFVDQTKPDNFSFGIGAESERLAGFLLKNFEDMWKVSKEISIEIPTKTG